MSYAGSVERLLMRHFGLTPEDCFDDEALVELESVGVTAAEAEKYDLTRIDGHGFLPPGPLRAE